MTIPSHFLFRQCFSKSSCVQSSSIWGHFDRARFTSQGIEEGVPWGDGDDNKSEMEQ